MKIPVYCKILFIAFNTVDIYIYIFILYMHICLTHMYVMIHMFHYFSAVYSAPLGLWRLSKLVEHMFSCMSCSCSNYPNNL